MWHWSVVQCWSGEKPHCDEKPHCGEKPLCGEELRYVGEHPIGDETWSGGKWNNERRPTGEQSPNKRCSLEDRFHYGDWTWWHWACESSL